MYKLDKSKILAARQNTDEMVHALKQVIQGVLVAECGAYQLRDISTHELKKEVSMLLAIAARIQKLMIKNCPGSEDIFKRHFNGGEVPLIAELVVIAFGLSDDTIENVNNELKAIIAKEAVKEPAQQEAV